MAKLSAAEEEINRKRAEAGLTPRFPETATEKVPDTLKRPTGPSMSAFGDLFGADKQQPITENKAPDMLKRPTDFPNNLTPKSSLLSGGVYFGMEGRAPTSKTDTVRTSAPTPPLVTKSDKDSQFGSLLGPRSTSALSQNLQSSKTYSGIESTSSLRQPARSLGTQSGAMRREARRLRREGYFEQAGQMAGAAAAQRLTEPNILTEAQRTRMGLQSKQADVAGQEAAALQGEYTQFMRDAIKKRREEMES